MEKWGKSDNCIGDPNTTTTPQQQHWKNNSNNKNNNNRLGRKNGKWGTVAVTVFCTTFTNTYTPRRPTIFPPAQARTSFRFGSVSHAAFSHCKAFRKNRDSEKKYFNIQKNKLPWNKFITQNLCTTIQEGIF